MKEAMEAEQALINKQASHAGAEGDTSKPGLLLKHITDLSMARTLDPLIFYHFLNIISEVYNLELHPAPLNFLSCKILVYYLLNS